MWVVMVGAGCAVVVVVFAVLWVGLVCEVCVTCKFGLI